ncbi:MAG: TonB family protein [Verrucomicrobia bacterium]|nr:TonB family protein [Verrucomicrobiota bacterium]
MTTIDTLNHLWQSTAAGLAVLVLLRLGASLSARTRRALGLMALAKFVVPVALLTALVARFGSTRERWLEAPALTLPVNLPAAIVAPGTIPSAADSTASPSVSAVLATAWGAGFVALVAWWGVRGGRLRRRILAAALPVPPGLERRLADLAARTGLRSPPRCVLVDDSQDAGVLGIFSPVVILPRGLEEKLTGPELDAVLLHEFVHVRRRDNLWSAAQYLLAAAFWFHPLVWRLHRRTALEAEKACDERVLELTGDAGSYASGIMKCVRHALGVAQPGLAGVTTPPIVSRLRNILAHGTRRDRPLVRRVVLGAGVLSLALSGYAGSFSAAAQAPAAGPPQTAAAPPASATAVAGSAPSASPAPAPASPPGETTRSIDFPDEPLATIIRNVAELFQLNVIIPGTLTGRTTVRLKDVTWRQIFQIVLAPVDYTFVEEGNLIRIVAKDPVTERQKLVSQKHELALAYLTQQADRLRQEAAEAQQRLDRYRAAPGNEEAAAAEREVLARLVDTATKNAALVDARRRAVEEAAAATAESSRLAAIAAEREAREQQRRAQEREERRQKTIARGAADAPTNSSDSTYRPTGRVIAPASPPPVPSADDRMFRGAPVYDIGQLDQTPVPKYQARPQYPFELRRQGITGEVLVDFIVDADGNVANAYARSSTRPEFEAPAVQAVSKWRFRPGRKGGGDVHTHMQVPIAFTLNER